MAKSTVYFTKEITPEAVLKMYRQLGVELPGKVAVKVHSGEDGNQNFLRPEFMKPVIDAVHGRIPSWRPWPTPPAPWPTTLPARLPMWP